MQYYAFELDEESSNLCVIVTPFGKYKYKRLPMGICLSTDIAQEIMESVLQDIEGVEIYLDDIGIFSNNWDSHIQTLQIVLTRLQENGFTVNPLKCEWAVKETDWLGYWLTTEGLKPWTKKIKAIQAIKPPTNIRQLRSFIGMVNYYKEMWPHRSHIMAPLTSITGHKFKWDDVCQKAFNEIKRIIAQDVILTFILITIYHSRYLKMQAITS
jgi:Reverse transcriptase (RNA-dependent DNA polymerase).